MVDHSLKSLMKEASLKSNFTNTLYSPFRDWTSFIDREI